MFSKLFVLFLAFLVAIASARPLRHHHRRSCPHSSASSVVVSAIATPTAAALNLQSSKAPTSKAVEPSSTTVTKVSKSSKKTSTSTETSTTSPKASASVTPAKSPASLLAKLFPVDSSSSWSTVSAAAKPFPLADSTFRPTNLIASLPHPYTTAPDGYEAMKAHYPKGSYTFTHQPEGGLSFYAPGPNGVDLTTAKEATFGYSVYFPAGFAFNLGGKLPGLYGGNSAEEAIGCSGGSRSAACFSARFMWRQEGAGELYTYLPPATDSQFKANKGVCDIPPFSTCNDVYGASVGRGSFTFATSGWTTISQRVRLNDPGQANGELEVYHNGVSVINVSGLILRDSSAGRIRGMQMQTFFGGSDVSYASPKDQDVYFSDFSVAITETL